MLINGDRRGSSQQRGSRDGGCLKYASSKVHLNKDDDDDDNGECNDGNHDVQ